MEEIDSIIIESLRNLQCDIEDTATNLKHFDADMVLCAISTCLETIIPGSTFPKKQPPSMSVKLKIATSLAQQIKDLGFREDIGYQTILYCNESEIRRVLMFLIERLPRDTSKVLQIEQTGYVPSLVKEIEKRVKSSMEQFWLPSSMLGKGCRKINGLYLVNSTGESCSVHAQKLKVSDSRNVYEESLKQYWIHNVPEVTKQCSPRKLLPSLLFNDFEVDCDDSRFQSVFKSTSDTQQQVIQPDLKLDDAQLTTKLDRSDSVAESDTKVSKTPDNNLQLLIQALKDKQVQYTNLKSDIKKYEMQLSQNKNMKSEEEEVLKDTLSKVNLKSKTLSVIGKEENVSKLKKLIENSNSKLVHLANQWNEVQTPLLEEYKSLQNTLNSRGTKAQQEQSMLKKLRDNCQALTADLNEKKVLEESLKQKLEHVNKHNNRSGYTQRIFEIIGNIKKQDNEIQKILKDTREVQKEISNLTGQVDRSFTLSDELIFQDAKQDETARKAYKLLVVLHEECAAIIKAVTDLGLVERESRNLQEQIDLEMGKETGVKLEKVYKDLVEMRRETEILLKQNKT